MTIFSPKLVAFAMIKSATSGASLPSASAFLLSGCPSLLHVPVKDAAFVGRNKRPKRYTSYKHHVASNHKYARLRRRLSAKEDSFIDQAPNSPQQLAQETMAVLSRKGKTWKRLGPLVEVACGQFNEKSTTIADVGTDHGMLSIALAATGRYEKVFGVDVSEKALENGARKYKPQVLDVLSRDSPIDEAIERSMLPVEFRAGDGLTTLDKGEADTVAVAGVGVNTMMKILIDKELQRIGSRELLLQPTNSRPRNLILLYDYLQRNGFVLRDEHINFISNRWYISNAWYLDTRQESTTSMLKLPGDKLKLLPEEDNRMYEEHLRYVDHHRSWLERDLKVKGSLEEPDSRWFKEYGSPQ